MDYTTISCGVAGQENPISKEGKEKILSAICELLKNGYRRFLIALTGEATLTFAEGVLSALEHYPDAGIDVLIPFDGWIEEQADSARYKQISKDKDGIYKAYPMEATPTQEKTEPEIYTPKIGDRFQLL